MKEEGSNNGRSSQRKTNNRADRERPHTVISLPEHDVDGRERDNSILTGQWQEQVNDPESPSHHTYALLEGPVLPLRRHNTQFVAMRKKPVNPSRTKRFSDTNATHIYDSLGPQNSTENGMGKKSHAYTGEASVTNASSADEFQSSNEHHYAVLEGPTPVDADNSSASKETVGGSYRVDRRHKTSIQLCGGFLSSAYDRLAPKNTENTVIPGNKGTSDIGGQGANATYNRLSKSNEIESPQEKVHMYDTLEPDKKKSKLKFSKSKKNLKKKRKHSNTKQAPTDVESDSPHIYDVLEFKSEMPISGAKHHQSSEVLTPTTTSTGKGADAIASDRKINCEGPKITNTKRKRILTHSHSSRTLCDVTETRNRSFTVFTAASDTNLNRINPENEVHIYDTVEVFPAISKRQRKLSGKRYRWLPLKEQLQKQERTGYIVNNEPSILSPSAATSCHVTGLTCNTRGVSSGTTPEAEPADLIGETHMYASLDKTQTYAQVEPFVPHKKGSVEQLKSVNEESSEYAHLQHR